MFFFDTIPLHMLFPFPEFACLANSYSFSETGSSVSKRPLHTESFSACNPSPSFSTEHKDSEEVGWCQCCLREVPRWAATESKLVQRKMQFLRKKGDSSLIIIIIMFDT